MLLQRPHGFRTALAVLFLLLAAGSASAQIARVSGIVRDVNGQPLRGALVTAESGSGSATATTDDNGRFSIIGLRPGTWTFEVQAPSYITETGQMVVRAIGAQNQPVTIALRRSGVANSGPLGSLPSRDIQADLSAADSLFEEQRWNDAIDAYAVLLKKAPTLTAINLQIAAAHRHLKNYDGAIDAYQTMLKADPANEQAHVGISMTSLDRGDTQAAQRALLEAAAAPSPGRQVLYSLAELEMSAGRLAEATSWYEKAASADRSWGKPLYRLGEMAMTSGDESSAARYLGEVIAVDPSSPEAVLAKEALDRLNK
jgi:tetratricopeptide (TPR) repeat protein